jgi:hypothetical protein
MEMTMNATKTLPAILSAGALALCFASPANAQTNYGNNNEHYNTMRSDHGFGYTPAGARDLPINRGTDVNDIRTACTGVGVREEQEVRWHNYPVKLVAANNRGQYLAGETVTVRGDRGGELLRVKCDAPWVLMKLDPGRYSATVRAPNGMVKHVMLRVPEYGQRRIVVHFPTEAAQNYGNGTMMLPSGA